MASLPPARRVVTGHNSEGKAVIDSDTVLKPIDPHSHLPPPKGSPAPEPADELTSNHVRGGFILMFRTDGFPAKSQGPWTDYHGSHISLADAQSTTVRIVDMPPGMSSPMHRTHSLDIGTVIYGEVVMELDDGAETILRAGDTVVQRGTIHAWHNRTQEMTRMSFVLLPGQPVVVNGETLQPTKFVVN